VDEKMPSWATRGGCNHKAIESLHPMVPLFTDWAVRIDRDELIIVTQRDYVRKVLSDRLEAHIALWQ
jgi:hypothetical protein